MSHLSFVSSINCRFSLLSFYVLSYTVLLARGFRFEKFQLLLKSIFIVIASYKFTKIRWDNGELPVFSRSA